MKKAASRRLFHPWLFGLFPCGLLWRFLRLFLRFRFALDNFCVLWFNRPVFYLTMANKAYPAANCRMCASHDVYPLSFNQKSGLRRFIVYP
jgi:hypothetical protein